MKKRTKRKVWPKVNTIAHVIEGVGLIPEHLLDELRKRELGPSTPLPGARPANRTGTT